MMFSGAHFSDKQVGVGWILGRLIVFIALARPLRRSKKVEVPPSNFGLNGVDYGTLWWIYFLDPSRGLDRRV